jgi:acyl-CoA dehydrogenase
MEVLAKYGTTAQKEQWLKPLMEGTIRSAFCMTEPDVASSDATNIQLEISKQGNEYVINGRKWWISGAGDPRTKIFIVMGKTDPNNSNIHKQQSVILVPADTPGITIIRAMKVYGFDDAPHGHMEIEFKNVLVPLSSIILGEGRGFEVMQGRLGPGRIHHCMRAIGMAERALEYHLLRLTDPSRKTFGKLLAQHGINQDLVCQSRLEIDQARLLVLNAAAQIDKVGAKGAMNQIAMAKIIVPNMALQVIDRSIQAHGGAGVSQDFPLANMYAFMRTLRIADGPDEVHRRQVARAEFRRVKDIKALYESRKANL